MFRRCALVLIPMLVGACLEAPPPDSSYERVADSAEVFRIFCLRAARSAYPHDETGERFHPMCDGEVAMDDEPDETLKTLIRNRDSILGALELVLGERGGEEFEDGELKAFLRALIPLYGEADSDPPGLIPRTTRSIATMLGQAADDADPRARAALDTIARVSARAGYRPPELVLGASRSLLRYSRLEQLADLVLPVIGQGGSAREEWLNLLRATALELADDGVPASDPDATTLHVALALLLRTDPSLAGTSGPLPVLQRDLSGDALALQHPDPMPTPFGDDGERDRDGLALADGQPVYQSFDANRTVLAGAMRLVAPLLARQGEQRAGLESLARGLKPLLGPWQARTITIGKSKFDFQGPDLGDAPLMELVNALTALARYPETDALLDALQQLLTSSESEAVALVYGGLRIDERADDFPNAVLRGPHEFWDDLIAIGTRMLQRPGLLEAVIRSFADPKSASLGKVMANWMRHRDLVTYRNAPIVISPPGPYTDAQKADVNAEVEHSYSELVDRTSADAALNRSVWQRTMSLINGLNRTRICNKDNAVLRTPTAIGELVFPTSASLGGDGYKACDLIEIGDSVEVYLRAALGKGKIIIKDDFVNVLGTLGQGLGIVGSIADVQEQASQIDGFRDSITAPAAARFLFAPPNKFVSDLFEPAKHKDGVPIPEYEPYGLFPMEVKDAVADGESFLSAGVPLMKAFDEHELRDADGKLPDHYLFGDLLSVMHTHWPSRHEQPCAAIGPGNEGCVQSVEPAAPFYVPGTNLVSYEELLAQAFLDEDYVGLLRRAAAKLTTIKVGGKDGVTVLADFAARLLTQDPTLKTRAGKAYTTTNTCVEVAGPACQGGGSIIPQLTPLYLVLDALKGFDRTWDAEAARAEDWRAGRGKLVDDILGVERTGAAGSYRYTMKSRDAYGVVLNALPWLREQLKRHAEDLETWSAGLSDRLAHTLSHPMAAGGLDLLDALWAEPAASGEFLALASSLLGEADEPEAYRGTLVSAADLLTLLDRDPDFSPAIQFAALGLAPNAFRALDGEGPPDVENGAASEALEFTREAVAAGGPAFTKLLRNLVIAEERSPAEVIFDAVANVNRSQPELPNDRSLSAEEDRKVFGDVKLFMYDDGPANRSLERLYSVIQHRELP